MWHKNYAYKIVDTATGDRKTVCKVRVITLNYKASQLVNFVVIKDIILGKTETEQVTVHTEKKNKLKGKAGGGVVSIITETENKLYRSSFFKRRRLHDNTSVPFGYKYERITPLNVILISMFKLISTSDYLKIKHPFSCMVCGASGSGKCSFCIRFLQILDALCTKRNFGGGVIWC